MQKIMQRLTLLAALTLVAPTVVAQVNPTAQEQQQQRAALKQKARVEKQRAAVEKQKAKAEKQKVKAKAEEAKLVRKAQKARQDFLTYKTPGTVYVFGVSQTLGESQVCITDISQIDSLALQKKTNFLPFRTSFSLQLQQYTEGTLGHTNQTCSVLFSTNRKKLQKQLDKLKRRTLSKEGSTLTFITTDQFRFIHPLDQMQLGAAEQ